MATTNTRAWVGSAVRIGAARTVEDLSIEQRTIESRRSDELVVRVQAAAVNRSDVLNVSGAFPHVKTGRVPGRDFAGTVIGGPEEIIGTDVWGTGGDLGLTSDGSHAEHLVVPVSAALPRPAELDVLQAGAAGLAFMTAALAVESTLPQAGQTVLVTGAAGAVGAAVIGLARHGGAHVVGVVRGAAQVATARELGVDFVLDLDLNELGPSLRAAGLRTIDVAVDCVGPPVMSAILPHLGVGGRLCLLTAPRGGELRIEVLDFYRRALHVVGLNTLTYDAVRSSRILREVGPALRSGHLKPPRIAGTFPLAEARVAYAAVRDGAHSGRVVLIPAAG